MNLADSHAHFGSCVDGDETALDAVLEAMKSASVKYAVQIGTSVKDSDWSASFANAHENIFFTVGIHPEYASEPGEDPSVIDRAVSSFRNEIENGKLIGIGEVGLDYHFRTDNKKEQAALFEAQIDIAKRNNLMLVIHSRDAFEDTVAIMKNQNVEKAVLHCFGGDDRQAKTYIDMGFFISFAGNVTYKKALDIQSAAVYAPIDRIMLETDCPYLAPQAVRGRKNQPSFVSYTYEFVAALRKTSVAELADCIEKNFLKFAGRA
jgi:TatD DNase family protein